VAVQGMAQFADGAIAKIHTAIANLENTNYDIALRSQLNYDQSEGNPTDFPLITYLS
jgi:hypothetical protein